MSVVRCLANMGLRPWPPPGSAVSIGQLPAGHTMPSPPRIGAAMRSPASIRSNRARALRIVERTSCGTAAGCCWSTQPVMAVDARSPLSPPVSRRAAPEVQCVEFW